MCKKWAVLLSVGLMMSFLGQGVAHVKVTAETVEQEQTLITSERDMNAGYFDLLDANSYYEFSSWLIDEKGFDLNDDQDSIYIDNNFNQLLFEAIDEGVIRDITNPNLRWSYNQHTFISFYSMDGLLANDGKSYVRNFFNQSAGNGSNYFSSMVDGFYDPDRDENQNGFEGHFYGYNTQAKGTGNYRSGVLSYDISARTRLEQHYQAAIQAWKAGYRISAMDELGRAIHYLCDMGQPLHTLVQSPLTMAVHISKHSQYETWVDLVQANIGPSREDSDPFDYWLDSANNNMPNTSTNYYDFMRNESFETICDTITSHAYNYAESILTVPAYGSIDEIWNSSYAMITYNEATAATIPVVQGVVAGLLNRFYEEVQLTQTIQNNGVYRIQNVSSGKYLNVSNGSITMQNYSSSSNQKFKLEYRENDSDSNTICRGFSLYSLSDQKFFCNYLTNGLAVSDMAVFNNNYNFLPVPVTGNCFRIMHDDIHLRNVIGSLNDYWLWRETNNPETSSQLWRFIPA